MIHQWICQLMKWTVDEMTFNPTIQTNPIQSNPIQPLYILICDHQSVCIFYLSTCLSICLTFCLHVSVPLFPLASHLYYMKTTNRGRIRTLDHRMMSRAFYHCVTRPENNLQNIPTFATVRVLLPVVVFICVDFLLSQVKLWKNTKQRDCCRKTDLT
jgi:hypothetical protein